MDGRMWAAQINEQQMEQTEPGVDAERPPKKPPGRAMNELDVSINEADVIQLDGTLSQTKHFVRGP
jgi:hypothetical protein